MGTLRTALVGQTGVLSIKKNGEQVSRYRPDLGSAEIDISSAEKTTTTGKFTTINGGKLESCIVDLEPIQDLHGYDNPWVGGSGKNLIPMTVANLKAINTSGTWSGNTYTFQNGAIIDVLTDDDGNVIGFKGSGTTTASTSYNFNLCEFDFVSGTTYKLNGITGGSNSTYRINIAGVSNYSSGDNTVNGDGSTHSIRIQMQASYSPLDFTVTPMLRLATETDATFEPYTNICGITGHSSVEIDVSDSTDYTTALSATVYGGNIDVVSGSGKSKYIDIDLGNCNYSYNADRPWFTIPQGTFPELKAIPNDAIGDMYCTCYEPTSRNYIYNNPSADSLIAINPSKAIIIRDLRFTDPADLKAALSGMHLIAERDTYADISCTPTQINTLIGENHLDVPLEGQSLDSAVYREMMAWDDVMDVVDTRLPISAIGTDESNNDTASKAYSQGDYFYKNGIAKAKTGIAQGATFTLNTNYEIKTLAEILQALEA